MQRAINDQVLAVQIVRVMANRKGRLLNLAEIADKLQVPRENARQIVSKLRTEGFVDALQMSLTTQGIALAVMLDGGKRMSGGTKGSRTVSAQAAA